jgi:hypothetical protein
MAIGTKERTELRDVLAGQGYHWDYIDEWTPKVTLYRHRAMISPSGEVVSPVGTALHNLPGNPDYVEKKSRIGLFTWPPDQGCRCRWCRDREATGASVVPPAEAKEEPRGKRKGKMGPHFKSDS